MVDFGVPLPSESEVDAVVQAEEREPRVGRIEQEELPVGIVAHPQELGKDERSKNAREQANALGNNRVCQIAGKAPLLLC